MPVNDASQRQQAAADRRLRDQIRAIGERANGGFARREGESERARNIRFVSFFAKRAIDSSVSCSCAHLSPSNLLLSLTVERDDLVDLSSNKLEQELNTLNALSGQSEFVSSLFSPLLLLCRSERFASRETPSL